MRSVSIALLEAIDRRLCALVSGTKANYIGFIFADLEAEFSALCIISIAGDITSVTNFHANFKGFSSVLCWKANACVLAVVDADASGGIFKCISQLEQVNAFVSGLRRTKRNWVTVTEDGTITTTKNGRSIQFGQSA